MKRPTQAEIDECKILRKRYEKLDEERMQILRKFEEILGEELHQKILDRAEERVEEAEGLIDVRGGTIREQYTAGLQDYFDELQEEDTEAWLLQVTMEEFRQIAKERYPNLTEAQYENFSVHVSDNFEYSRIFGELEDMLDEFMKEEFHCPDPSATHRQCVKYVPIMRASKFTLEERQRYLQSGVEGICDVGGFTEIGDPDVKLCQQDDGWCTAYQQSEPFQENDLVIPTSDEVRPLADKFADSVLAEYPLNEYEIYFSYEVKREYMELHYVANVFRLGKKIATKREAYVKSHMTGEIESI